MSTHWVFREPSLAFGLPVYLAAGLFFPLHLGWVGAPVLSLVAYVAIAAVLFALADLALNRTLYAKLTAVAPQSMLSFLALAIPAALAFAAGAALGPVDERADEEACASQGASEMDTPEAEADDTFDVTADCA